MSRRLPTIAKWINANVEGLTATIEQGYCNTDRKIGRLRVPGKGRRGNRLIVKHVSGYVVLDHNAAETYRYNKEVEDWLEKWVAGKCTKPGWCRFEDGHRRGCRLGAP